MLITVQAIKDNGPILEHSCSQFKTYIKLDNGNKDDDLSRENCDRQQNNVDCKSYSKVSLIDNHAKKESYHERVEYECIPDGPCFGLDGLLISV